MSLPWALVLHLVVNVKPIGDVYSVASQPPGVDQLTVHAEIAADLLCRGSREDAHAGVSSSNCNNDRFMMCADNECAKTQSLGKHAIIEHKESEDVEYNLNRASVQQQRSDSPPVQSMGYTHLIPSTMCQSTSRNMEPCAAYLMVPCRSSPPLHRDW